MCLRGGVLVRDGEKRVVAWVGKSALGAWKCPRDAMQIRKNVQEYLRGATWVVEDMQEGVD